MYLALGEYRGPASARAFLGYARARMRREVDSMAFMAYVTDSLRLSRQDKFISKRWIDIVRPPIEEDVASIVTGVVARAGLVVE